MTGAEDYPPDVPEGVDDVGSQEVGDDASSRVARRHPDESLGADDVHELERAARELLEETGDDELRRALAQLGADRANGESLRPAVDWLTEVLARRSG